MLWLTYVDNSEQLQRQISTQDTQPSLPDTTQPLLEAKRIELNNAATAALKLDAIDETLASDQETGAMCEEMCSAMKALRDVWVRLGLSTAQQQSDCSAIEAAALPAIQSVTQATIALYKP